MVKKTGHIIMIIICYNLLKGGKNIHVYLDTLHITPLEDQTVNWNHRLHVQKETGWTRGREERSLTLSVPFEFWTMWIYNTYPKTKENLKCSNVLQIIQSYFLILNFNFFLYIGYQSGQKFLRYHKKKGGKKLAICHLQRPCFHWGYVSTKGN